MAVMAATVISIYFGVMLDALKLQIRPVSLLLRRRHSRLECARTLGAFEEWRDLQRQLHAPYPRGKRLLIIRLDDIGDYLLFRNHLSMYKDSARWGTHAITLLGNLAWKEIFTACDHRAVDDTIWVDKGAYLSSAAYRFQIWAMLRERGFETVIAPSRTRPLLLDDLCRLAAAPVHGIASANSYVHADWNRLSDALYQELFVPGDARAHEFHFNRRFAAWSCGIRFGGIRPLLELPDASGAAAGPDIICFVGANTRSRRWPAKRWVEFIKAYRSRHDGRVILAGGSRAEQQIAARIQAQTGADNIVGTVSLLELAHRLSSARAVLSNDTMAVHLSVSLGRPTLIIANGVNYQRFTDYDTAGIEGVATLYPRVFDRKRRRRPDRFHHYTDALTSDIASIGAAEVLDRLEALLAARQNEPYGEMRGGEARVESPRPG